MTAAIQIEAPAENKSSARYFRVLKVLLRHRTGCFGLTVLLALLSIAVLAPLIAPYDPIEISYDGMLGAPSSAHWLGTDELGRDILSRLMFGAQVSLEIVVASTAMSLVVGTVIGIISGYFGGQADNIIMRIMDVLLAFPLLILALGIIAVLGPSVFNATLAIAIVNVPGFARLVRGQVLYIRELDFVQAIRALGAGRMRIMARHIWPSVAGNVIVYASLRASTALITESSLAFLGLGAQPPEPSWGQMLATSMEYWDAWWMSIFPGAAIFLTALSFNFLGDGLRDALDVRIDE